MLCYSIAKETSAFVLKIFDTFMNHTIDILYIFYLPL